MKKITILGSTGSIGQNTLSVIRDNPEKYQVHTLVANRNVDAMVKQCIEFSPFFAVMTDESSATQLRTRCKEHGLMTEIFAGLQVVSDLVALDEVDQVMSAIVGSVGLQPTLAAIHAGKRILLANKESLVTCGKLFIDAVKAYSAELLPVDSEHNAIYQSLPSGIQQDLGFAALDDYGVSRIILTGSGGPFRETPLGQLVEVTADQACSHPNWSMGRKISVDSATMMNKGLEFIEARWLFNASMEQIEVIIHPQSVIHSMVRYIDGSVIAQLGVPDMRTPIAHAMASPKRIQSGAKSLDFGHLSELTFSVPEMVRYPCLALAIEASRCGQAATTALNAANEVAVAAFLEEKIRFTDIAALNTDVMNQLDQGEPLNVEMVLDIDRWARNAAKNKLVAYNIR